MSLELFVNFLEMHHAYHTEHTGKLLKKVCKNWSNNRGMDYGQLIAVLIVLSTNHI